MFLVNVAADDTLLIKSDMLFHNRLPRDFIESMPNTMLFAAGMGSISLVLRSYLTSFLIKYSCMKGGLTMLSVLYISIKSTQRFWVWIFVSSFFTNKVSNLDSWSSGNVLIISVGGRGQGAAAPQVGQKSVSLKQIF